MAQFLENYRTQETFVNGDDNDDDDDDNDDNDDDNDDSSQNHWVCGLCPSYPVIEVSSF
jgi:hypothetical protein